MAACIDVDTLAPSLTDSPLVAQERRRTLPAGALAYGAFITYLNRPILIESPTPTPRAPTAFGAVDHLVDVHLSFAYGLTRSLSWGVGLPVGIGSGSGTSPITGGDALPLMTLRDLRLGPTVDMANLFKIPEPNFALTLAMPFTIPIGTTGAFAGEGVVTFRPSINAGYRVKHLRFGLDLGARIRPVREFWGVRWGTQFDFAAGAAYQLIEALSVGADFRWLPTLISQTGGVSSTLGEWSISVESRPFPEKSVALVAAGGSSVGQSIGAPRARFSLGIRFSPE